MASFALRRLLVSIPLLLIATFLVFWAVRTTFDPTAKLAASRDAAQVRAEMRERLGLDDPIIVQYGRWLGKAVTGDLGTSSRTNEPVSSMVWPALGNTMQLIVWGFGLALVLSIGIGVFSAVRQYSIPDYIFTGLSYIGLAMPPFWFALVASQLLGPGLKNALSLDEPIFYVVGLHSDGGGFDLDYFRHLFLPVLTLTVQIVAGWSRYQRSTMLEVLNTDYIRTARAKGLRERSVIFRHGLRNALVPVLSVVAIDAGALFGGLIITESIFSIPGMGRLFVEALNAGDVDTVLAWTLVSAVFVIMFNLLADLAYGFLDPRVRLT